MSVGTRHVFDRLPELQTMFAAMKRSLDGTLQEVISEAREKLVH